MGSEPPDPSPAGLIGNLFNAILDSCANAYQRLTSTEQSRRLRSELERFFLWGDGVSATDGHLDKALATSSELYQTVLSALHELGKVVNEDLTQAVAPLGQINSVADTRELQLLLKEAGAILNAPNTTGDSESLSDDENGPYSLEDIIDDMETYIDCLMDLSPAVENTLAYSESIRSAVIDSIVSSCLEVQTPQLSSIILAGGHATSLGIDDGGLPGFQATITLFEGTPRERVVHLGPWAVEEWNQRRVIWQGASQYDILEHYFPSNDPSDLHPHTLHTRHRPYLEPADTERYITFRAPHRIRYTTHEGVCIHDESINVKYEFASVQTSIQFQGDLRRKDLIDFFDIDVAWTDIHGRTDSFGNVKGVATIQRLKLWRDRSTGLYSLSIRANRVGSQNREYSLDSFRIDISRIDDRAKQLRLKTLHQDRDDGRRPITAYQIQPRRRVIDFSASGPPEPRPSEFRPPIQPPDNIRYLAIQFSDRGAYQRFIETWATCQGRNSELQWQPTPSSISALPSQSRSQLSRIFTQNRTQGGTPDLIPRPSSPDDAPESSSQRRQ